MSGVPQPNHVACDLSGRDIRSNTHAVVDPVSPLAIRRRLIRARGSLAASCCLFALAGAVAAHHGGMPSHHGGMDMHGVATMVICLGVLSVAALAVPARPALRRLRRLRAPLRLHARELRLPARGAHPTRAGPPLFLRLEVLRR